MTSPTYNGDGDVSTGRPTRGGKLPRMGAIGGNKPPQVGRGAITADAIADVALTLFAERGYHGTPLSAIAQQLQIATPSLYNHMGSKQDLLIHIVRTTTEGVLADFERAMAEQRSHTDRLREVVRVYALRHATRPREALVVNRDAMALEEPIRGEVFEKRRAHADGIRALLVAGQKAGEFADLDPRVGAFAILEMCVGVARWFDPHGSLDAESVATEHARLAIQMVGRN